MMPKLFTRVTKRNVNPNNPEHSFQTPEHYTSMWLEVPMELATNQDPSVILSWICEEFNYTFMGDGVLYPCFTENEIEELMESVI